MSAYHWQQKSLRHDPHPFVPYADESVFHEKTETIVGIVCIAAGIFVLLLEVFK